MLAVPREGVVDADDRRDDQHGGKHHVVPNPEGADTPRRVHGRTVAWALCLNWRLRGAQPDPELYLGGLALTAYFPAPRARGRGALRGRAVSSSCRLPRVARTQRKGKGDMRRQQPLHLPRPTEPLDPGLGEAPTPR